MKRLLKFSYAPKDHKVQVKYTQTTADGRVETITLESAEAPRPEQREELPLGAGGAEREATRA